MKITRIEAGSYLPPDQPGASTTPTSRALQQINQL
jgi:hypothetical protein